MSIPLEDVIIARAREILATKRAWTSSAEARTARGDRCLPYDSGAVRFCGYGALTRAAFELTGDLPTSRVLANASEKALLSVAGVSSRGRPQRLSHINDRSGYKAVLKLLSAPRTANKWLLPQVEASGVIEYCRGGWRGRLGE